MNMIIKNGGQTGKRITIKRFCSFSINNDGDFVVNGKRMSISEMIANGYAYEEGGAKNDKTLEITINGNVESIDCEASKIVVNGSCGNVTTNMGDIDVKGDVNGSVRTNMGNIMCGNVEGNATTNLGNVSYRR